MTIAKPTQVATPFANSGLKNTIPQSATGSNLASLEEGFPAVTMTAVADGGTPPQGQDFNGVLYQVTNQLRYAQAGGLYPYDATFCTSIGGYPLGAILMSSDGKKIWQNQVAGNTNNPDSNPTNWSNILGANGGNFSSIVATSNDSIFRSSNAGSLGLIGGTSATTCANLYLRGETYSGAPGNFTLQATNGSQTSTLQGAPDGILTWRATQFEFVNNTSGTYKQFSDGSLICYGTIATNSSGTAVTFPYPFISNPIVLTSHLSVSQSAGRSNVSTTGFTAISSTTGNSTVTWLAIGRWK